MRRIRRSLALVLTGVLLATSVAVPLLDSDAGSPTPAVETEHHRGTCGVAHDHQICVLAGASQWLDAGDGYRPPDRIEIHRIPAPVAAGPPLSRAFSLHHSRAPPVV